MGQIDIFRERLLARPPGLIMVDSDDVWVGVDCLAESFEIARELNFYIAGVEGFRCEGRYIVPVMDVIITGSSPTGTWSEIIDKSFHEMLSCVEVLQQTQSSFFDITLTNENDYRLI